MSTTTLSPQEIESLTVKAPQKVTLSSQDIQMLSAPTSRGQADDQQVQEELGPLRGTMLGKGMAAVSHYTDPANIPGVKNIVNYAGGMGAGIAQGIGGAIQALADQINPKLGQTVGQKTNALSEALAGPDPAGGGSQMSGQALPFMAAGEVLAPVKALRMVSPLMRSVGSGAVGGLTSLQNGATRAERNAGRLENAALGAAAGATFGMAQKAVSGIVNKLQHTKVIQKKLKDIQDEFEDYKPTAEKLATELSSKTQQVVRGLLRRNNNISTKAAAVGGPQTHDLVKVLTDVKEKVAHPIDEQNDLSAPFLEKVMKSLDPYLPKDNPKGGNVARASVTPAQRMSAADYLKMTEDSKTTPGKQGDLLELTGKAKEINSFLKKVPLGDRNTASYQALLHIQGSLEKTVKTFVDTQPVIKGLMADSDKRYQDFLDKVNDPAIRNFVTGQNADTKAAAALAIAKSGNGRQARKAAALLGPSDSKNIGKLIVHDALNQAFNAKKQDYDPAKFVAYFKEAQTNPSMKVFLNNDILTQVEGIKNLLSHNALEKGQSPSATTPMMARLGNVSGIGFMTGEVVNHFSHGRFNPFTIASAAAGAYAAHRAGQAVDNILNNKLGLAFLSASSKLKPGSPEMAQLIHVYGRRLANMGALTAGQSGAGSFLSQ